MRSTALPLILLLTGVHLCTATLLGPAKFLETYSSRYTLPNNDQQSSLPYSFGYRFTDGAGVTQEREEQTDASGAKTGSYGFVDAEGVFRRVEYVADARGFRAVVRSNEPGVAAHQDHPPAHVTLLTRPTPQRSRFNATRAPRVKSTPYVPFPLRAVVLVPTSPDPFDFFVFGGNKLTGFESDDHPPFHPTRYPRRYPSGRKGYNRVHTPRGYENHHDLPLYRDK